MTWSELSLRGVRSGYDEAISQGSLKSTPFTKRNSQLLLQIAPLYVHAIYQINLFLPRTALDLFLARYGLVHVIKCFIVHQSIHIIPLGETIVHLVFVFPDTSCQIVGDAGVEHSAVFVGEDVDEEGTVAHLKFGL